MTTNTEIVFTPAGDGTTGTIRAVTASGAKLPARMAVGDFVTLVARTGLENAGKLFRVTAHPADPDSLTVSLANGDPMEPETVAAGVTSLTNRPTLRFDYVGDAATYAPSPNPPLRIQRETPGRLIDCFSDGTLDCSAASTTKKMVLLDGPNDLLRVDWRLLNNQRHGMAVVGEGTRYKARLSWTRPFAPHGSGEGKWPNQFKGCRDSEFELSGPAGLAGRRSVWARSTSIPTRRRRGASS